MRHFSHIGIRIVSFLCLCLAAGCNGDSTESLQTGGDTGIATSALTRDTSPQVSDAELAAVVTGNTEFALKVFPRLDSTPDNNTFFSPYSITQAFALLAPGARGNTLTEIERTLSFPLPPERRNPAFNKLDLLVAGRTTGTVVGNGQSPKLTNANAVWAQQGFPILPAYLDTLAVNFGAGLHLVDFINAPEASRQTINSWVEEQTNNRIQDLVPQNGVTTDTRLVLTNAIWFKANWATQFPPGNTMNRPFTRRDGVSFRSRSCGSCSRCPTPALPGAGCRSRRMSATTCRCSCHAGPRHFRCVSCFADAGRAGRYYESVDHQVD